MSVDVETREASQNPGAKLHYSALFNPFSIGSCEIKNRIVMAPIGAAGLANPDGTYSERGVEYYATRARAGVGLIITGAAKVEREIDGFGGKSIVCVLQAPEAFIMRSVLLTEQVHSHNSRIFLQLTAGAGRAVHPRHTHLQTVAPSAQSNFWSPEVACREITVTEIETLVSKMAEGAQVAKEAGFDGVEIHALHEGYLLDQFAMALFNRRNDRYGGDLKGRLRFAIEIIQAIKKLCGAQFPVIMRYSVKSYIKALRQGGLPGEEFEEQGRDLEEGLQAARILEEAGYDAFDADAGTYDSWYWPHPPMYMEKGCYLPLSTELKRAVKSPVIVAGKLDDPHLAEAAILEGKADAIGLGRALLADPEWVLKVQRGEEDRIRPCIGCQKGCLGRIIDGKPLCCAVNPAVGREASYALQPTTTPKNVMVIGGGIGGMEAARVSAIRGHRVSLYERGSQLGGAVIPGSVPDFKDEDKHLLRWYERELKELKIAVHLNSEANASVIQQANPDAVLIATGSVAKKPPIPGLDGPNVLEATEIFLGKPTGEKVVVIGGGSVGCELALWLTQKGKRVTVVEALPDILSAEGNTTYANTAMLRDLLNFNHVSVQASVAVKRITEEGVWASINENGDEAVLLADTVALAVGYKPNTKLYDQIRRERANVWLLGDARNVSTIMNAVWDAYEVARSVN
jgi:2-enoate reductase